MRGFIQGEDRSQATLFPERLDDYVTEDSAVRVIDVFIDELDLSGLGFKTQPNDTGRPAYHPSTKLKLFDEYECPAGRRMTRRLTSVERGMTLYRYWSNRCGGCELKAQCTTGKHRRMTRWEHEAVAERTQQRLENNPDVMRRRRATVEHPFGTLKAWMGATHFLTKTLDRVNTEMSLHVLAYNLKRMMNLVGTKPLIEAIRA